MPRTFRMTYVGAPDLYYPELGLTPEVGKTYALAVEPSDGRWATPGTPPANNKKED